MTLRHVVVIGGVIASRELERGSQLQALRLRPDVVLTP